MKAMTKIGEVTVISKDHKNTINVLKKDGAPFRVMTVFGRNIWNLDGTDIDLATIPTEEEVAANTQKPQPRQTIIDIPTVKKMSTADLLAGLAENRGEYWDSKTRTFKSFK